jgi:hypothetical protein
MYAEIKTTITSRVEITDNGLGDVEHSVSIDPGELSEAAALALVEGAAKTLLAQFEEARS